MGAVSAALIDSAGQRCTAPLFAVAKLEIKALKVVSYHHPAAGHWLSKLIANKPGNLMKNNPRIKYCLGLAVWYIMF